jgi:hypothetical protein
VASASADVEISAHWSPLDSIGPCELVRTGQAGHSESRVLGWRGVLQGAIGLDALGLKWRGDDDCCRSLACLLLLLLLLLPAAAAIFFSKKKRFMSNQAML